MESVNAVDLKLLLNVLAHGEEQARFLEASLSGASSEHCKQIQGTFRKAISIAEFMKSSVTRLVALPSNTANAPDSPVFDTGSPRSEDSERFVKENERREVCKKRKTMPKWTRQVCLSPSGEREALEDGFSWRKYGQKDILGAKHPREYYRCTHKNTVGCLATKYMQKCGDNPLVFDITYRGEHTCQNKSKQAAISAPTELVLQQKQPNTSPIISHESQHNSQSQGLLLSFEKNLKLLTEGLDEKELQIPTSFSFPSKPINAINRPANLLIPTSSATESNFVSCFSPSFFSPATSSGSNYLSLSACGMSSYVAEAPAINTSESVFTGVVSTQTSTINSPLFEFGNMFDIAEFDYDI